MAEDEKRYDAKAFLEAEDLKRYGGKVTASVGGMRDKRFEIENEAVRKVLNEIANKIGGALDTGWGFLLMLFSYDDSITEGGGLFYLSSAERKDVLKMVREWMRRQEASDGLRAQELNPDDPTTRAIHDHWHKIVALLLLRLAQRDGVDPFEVKVNFQQPDIDQFAALAGGRAAVGVKDDKDGLTLFLAPEDVAIRQIKDGKAELDPPPTPQERRDVEGA